MIYEGKSNYEDASTLNQIYEKPLLISKNVQNPQIKNRVNFVIQYKA